MLQCSNKLETCLNRFSIFKNPVLGQKIIQIRHLGTKLALYKLSGEFLGERLREYLRAKIPKIPKSV